MNYADYLQETYNKLSLEQLHDRERQAIRFNDGGEQDRKLADEMRTAIVNTISHKSIKEIAMYNRLRKKYYANTGKSLI